MRQRRGQIAGLHNFGRTCFLNTLLQALAACPQFIAWLQLYNGASADRKSLITSLLNTLEVVNGTHSSLRGDPYSPGAVIRALTSLGWVIPQEEHDAHELFHVLLASLEEESMHPKQIGSISDALPENKITLAMQSNRPSSAMLSDFLNSDYDESTSLTRHVRSEAHTPDSPASACDHDGGAVGGVLSHDMLGSSVTELMGGASSSHNIGIGILNSMSSAPIPISSSPRQSRPRNIQEHCADGLNKRVSSSCRSLERLSRGPGRVSVRVF